jgi:predicted DNA-binding protein with PD1-like motif
MKVIVNENNTYLLRFDRNEDVIAELGTFCKEKNVQSGSFTALGATNDVVLAWYDVGAKKYTDHPFTDKLEIASCVGNIAWLKDDIVVHSHGVFSDNEAKTVAGHIKKMVVGATCEVTLITFSTKAERQFSEEIGLNLLK